MTSVDISNLALAYLGDTATVASIDPPEGSAQAQHCARFYPMALNLLLEAHQWNFITKRVTLALYVESPVSGWAYAYGMPADANDIISVTPQYLYPDAFTEPIRRYEGWGWQPFEFEAQWRNNFSVETLNGQPVILTNAYEAIARYTCTTVTPGLFPALFTDALAWKLASMLAGPLLKGDVGAAESKRCLQMSGVILEQAKGQDANQQHDQQRPYPSNLRARY